MPTTPSDGVDLRAVAHRIEQLLDELRSSADDRIWSDIEELVRALTDLYGAGLTRTVELAEHWAGPARPDRGSLLSTLEGDELVASLLVLHGVLPDTVAADVPVGTPVQLTRKRAAAGAGTG